MRKPRCRCSDIFEAESKQGAATQFHSSFRKGRYEMSRSVICLTAGSETCCPHYNFAHNGSHRDQTGMRLSINA